MIPPRNTNEVVIECITQAMAAMIIDRPFEEISITELVRRAGVSRNSFYRNFRDKEDVLRRYIEGETEEWISRLSGKSHKQRSLEGYSPWDHKESDACVTERAHTQDRKSTRLNSSHTDSSRMPSSA